MEMSVLVCSRPFPAHSRMVPRSPCSTASVSAHFLAGGEHDAFNQAADGRCRREGRLTSGRDHQSSRPNHRPRRRAPEIPRTRARRLVLDTRDPTATIRTNLPLKTHIVHNCPGISLMGVGQRGSLMRKLFLQLTAASGEEIRDEHDALNSLDVTERTNQACMHMKAYARLDMEGWWRKRAAPFRFLGAACSESECRAIRGECRCPFCHTIAA